MEGQLSFKLLFNRIKCKLVTTMALGTSYHFYILHLLALPLLFSIVPIFLDGAT